MEEKIDNLLKRGVEAVYPSREYLKSLLLSGKKIKLYLGIDPTGPSLHLGHAIHLKKLSEFQTMGHEVILLIGDFTAMIGDPTGKGEARKQLTREQVLDNAKLYKKQASKFLNFKGENPARLVYNSKWLGKMKFGDVLELASRMTVGQMLERDMFQKRIKESRPIYLHEFLYPLMQGYDSVALAVDGEIGGNDQIFNMLAGRNLSREISGKDKFVLASKLLVDSSGAKMGKSEGNMVTLADEPFDMFGKIMSWDDKLILPGFELCTSLSDEEISKSKERMSAGGNPRDEKILLAYEITKIYYGPRKSAQAKNNFINTFKNKETPADVKEVKVISGTDLKSVLLENGIVSSGSEFRRLVEEGAVSCDDTKVTDLFYKIETSQIIKVGKKRFLKINV
ncbi:MAG: tyrosine--tRNA ligase [Candidatus Paceibacterota bacterium]|jgi:tyrosyl-tRNA synthetase